MSDRNPIPYGEPLASDYESLDRQELKSRLSLFIEEMLHTNFEKLCNMIYRHDVDEHKFNRALEKESETDQAEAIAELVIERELQKIETRKAYRKQKEEMQRKKIEEENLEENDLRRDFKS